MKNTVKVSGSQRRGLFSPSYAAFIAAVGIAALSMLACDNGSEAHEHDWGEWRTIKAATCTTGGKEIRICASDPTQIEARASAPLGHDYRNYTLVTPPTIAGLGGERAVCEHDSSHVDTRAITYVTVKSNEELGTLLSQWPDNGVLTAYRVKLITSDIATVKTALNNNRTRYVYLDLSGNSITELPNRAFFADSVTRLPSLVGIIIPDSVTSIGELAFAYCGSLTSIIIPDRVTSIGQNAFFNSSLINVSIPDSVTSIGSGAFDGCGSLTNVNIPDGVTSIEASTFHSCTSLPSITIPNGVTSIGRGSFTKCTRLTSLTIPASVTSIAAFAFESCYGLTSVTFEGTIETANFNNDAFYSYSPPIGDLRAKYFAAGGGPGTYTRRDSTITTWTKQN